MAPESAQRLAAALDWGRAPGPGDELPPLWHWAYFPDLTPQSGLGADGHPQRNDELVARLPRRMAASGCVRLLEPCRIGRPAERLSELERFEEKEGDSGPLAFATWLHRIVQDERTVIEERQVIAYRASARPTAAPSARSAPAQETGDRGGLTYSGDLAFTPADLFRYSAVTWNAHRIHYDSCYARAEGYPGLVVHGPLLATVLVGRAVSALGELGEVTYRARAPVFVDDLVTVHFDCEGSTCSVEVRRPDGNVAMSLAASRRGA